MAAEETRVSLMEPELEVMLWMGVVDIRFCFFSTRSYTNNTLFVFGEPPLSVYGVYVGLASLLSSYDLYLVNRSHCNWLQNGQVTQSWSMRAALGVLLELLGIIPAKEIRA